MSGRHDLEHVSAIIPRAVPALTAEPASIRSRAQLDKAIRTAEMQGARLRAGANFGSKSEREACGLLLMQLADVARRCLDPETARAWRDAMPQDGAA